MNAINIRNYKNINNLTIGSLKRVNLIVGKNNVGKSTFLEALSIHVSGGDIAWIKQLLEFRGESLNFRTKENNVPEKELERYLSIFPDRKLDFSETGKIVIAQDRIEDLFGTTNK